MLPKTSTYVKSYDVQGKWMFFIENEPVYNKQFLKTEIKSHGDEVTDFYDKKIPKVDSNHTCLAVDTPLNKCKLLFVNVFKRVRTH